MRIHILILYVICAASFSACKKAPSHADYIPKDAIAVLGLHSGELGKKIAWEALWGSPLLKEMQQQMGDSSMMKEIQNSGIEKMATYYAYAKTDKRYDGGNRLTALIPLDDAAKWEAFLKKRMPGLVIKQQKDRKEAMLGTDAYASWNKDLLIITNVIYVQQDEYTGNEESKTADSMNIGSPRLMPHVPDDALLAVEMEKAFTRSDDNAITHNKHYKKLEAEGHDITLWLNYEAIMAYNTENGGGMMGGLSMAGNLWKDAALAMGIDFEDGKIAAGMHYYISAELKDAAKEMGETNADKDMIDRLPAGNLNLIAASHLSLKAVKSMLDKMGMIGFVNIALSQKGLTADDVVNAFSGDIVAAVNGFTVRKVLVPADSMYPGQPAYNASKMDGTYLYVLKTGKKEAFDKLLQTVLSDSLIIPAGIDHYTLPLPVYDNIGITVKNGFMVISNKTETANAYIAGSLKGGKLPGNAKEIYGHPGALFIDIKTLMAGMQPSVSNPRDSVMYISLKDMLSDVLATGGRFKDGAFEYNLSVNFTDKKENSLLQLVNYANKLKEVPGTQDVVYR